MRAARSHGFALTMGCICTALILPACGGGPEPTTDLGPEGWSASPADDSARATSSNGSGAELAVQDDEPPPPPLRWEPCTAGDCAVFRTRVQDNDGDLVELELRRPKLTDPLKPQPLEVRFSCEVDFSSQIAAIDDLLGRLSDTQLTLVRPASCD